VNHLARARGIVGRVMPRMVTTKKLGIQVDISRYHEELADAVARGLRQAERDARRSAILSAAKLVFKIAEDERAQPTDTTSFRVDALKNAADRVLELEDEE
jgi:hypothetical protein